MYEVCENIIITFDIRTINTRVRVLLNNYCYDQLFLYTLIPCCLNINYFPQHCRYYY